MSVNKSYKNVIGLIFLLILLACSEDETKTPSDKSNSMETQTISVKNESFMDFHYHKIVALISKDLLPDSMPLHSNLTSIINDEDFVTQELDSQQSIYLNRLLSGIYRQTPYTDTDINPVLPDCFNPRHGIAFLDEQGQIVHYLNISFECQTEKSSKKHKAEIDNLKGFFNAIGLMPTTENESHQKFFNSLYRYHHPVSPSAGKASFKGRLTYTVKLEIPDELPNDERKKDLFNKFGHTMTITYDGKGNFRKDYIGSANGGYEYQLYNTKSNNFYSKWKSVDTLVFYNMRNNTLQLISKNPGIPQNINGIECESVHYHGLDMSPVASSDYHIKLSWFFKRDSLFINPHHYANYKEYFYHDYLSFAQAAYLKHIIETPEMILTFQLQKVEPGFSLTAESYIPDPKLYAMNILE